MRKNDDKKTINTAAIILAGGDGKRFWPHSNGNIPEPFAWLMHDKTLFQMTYSNISAKFAVDDIWIVINKKYAHLVAEQVPAILPDFVIKEPLSRHTAPGVGLALAIIDDKYSDDTVICIFPSDQIVKNISEFEDAIQTACEAAYNLNALITIGITPTRTEVDYGYIQYSDDLNDDNNVNISEYQYNAGLRKSISFVEKPDKATAQRFINSGDFAWNSGILIARKDTLWNTFEKHLNYQYEQFRYIQQLISSDIYEEELLLLYKTLNKTSIDYSILESADNVFIIKSEFAWAGLNDWKELFNISIKDASDNVFRGNIISLNTNNSLAISDDKLLAIIGLNDIIVINTDNAILVCKKDDAKQIEELVNILKRNNIPFS